MATTSPSQFTQLAAVYFNEQLKQFSQERANHLLNTMPKIGIQHSSTYTHNKSIPFELAKGVSRDISLKGQFAETCRRSAELTQFEHVVIFEPNEVATEPEIWYERLRVESRNAIDAASRKITDEIMRAIYKPTQVLYSSPLAGQSGLYDFTEVETVIDATTGGLTIASLDAAIALLAENHGCELYSNYPSKGYLICDNLSLNNLQADMRAKSTPNVQFNVEEQLETYRNLRLLPVSNVRLNNLGIERYHIDNSGNLYLPVLKADAVQMFYSSTYASSSVGQGSILSLISSYEGDPSLRSPASLASMFSINYLPSNPAYNDKPSLAIRGMFGALRVDPTQMAFIKSKAPSVAGPFSAPVSVANAPVSMLAARSIDLSSAAQTVTTTKSSVTAAKGE